MMVERLTKLAFLKKESKKFEFAVTDLGEINADVNILCGGYEFNETHLDAEELK